jgi:hypothetical protein
MTFFDLGQENSPCLFPSFLDQFKLRAYSEIHTGYDQYVSTHDMISINHIINLIHMVKYAHNFRQSSAINPTALWAGTGIDDI